MTPGRETVGKGTQFVACPVPEQVMRSFWEHQARLRDAGAPLSHGFELRVRLQTPRVKLRTALVSPAKSSEQHCHLQRAQFLLLWANPRGSWAPTASHSHLCCRVLFSFQSSFLYFGHIELQLKALVELFGYASVQRNTDFRMLTKHLSLLDAVSMSLFKFCDNLLEKDS